MLTNPDGATVQPPAFDYQPRTRILFGVGAVQQVAEVAAALSARRALLVTDPGIVKAGHAEAVRQLLKGQGIQVACFDQVEENPGTRCVAACVELARASESDTIIGLGGGSSMDTAKGCNFLVTNGGEIRDYWGIGKAKKPMMPLIAIPTTGGTGSECQSFALITDEQTHQKMACGDPKAAARVAILDPALTISQPPKVTACSGIDAIAHAVETAVTNVRTPLSSLFSQESFRIMMAALPRVLKSPDDLEARGWMLLGAAWAGTAIENSMLGAAHSAANPLTAHFGTAHGQAVGMMLPHVVRFNSQDPQAAKVYHDLACLAHLTPPSAPPDIASELLAKRLSELLDVAHLARSLDRTVTPETVSALAAEAAGQWTAKFNPRPIAAADFEQLYRKVLSR
jgi:alcohol dehydrogenase